MSMPLARLVETVGRLRATTKKLEKVALIAELLRQTQGREAELVALYLSGTLPQGRIGIGWRTIQGAATESARSGEPLTLLDVEHLANALRSNSDWNVALEQYASEHDEYYGALHRILDWSTQLFWTPGPEADERRGRVFARMQQDPTGFPDALGLGPFGPSDERARRLMLGLD